MTPLGRCGYLSKRSGDRWKERAWYVLDNAKVRRLPRPCALCTCLPTPARPHAAQLCYYKQRPTAEDEFPDGVDVFFDETCSAGEAVTQTAEGYLFDVICGGSKLRFRAAEAAEAQEWLYCIKVNTRLALEAAAESTAGSDAGQAYDSAEDVRPSSPEVEARGVASHKPGLRPPPAGGVPAALPGGGEASPHTPHTPYTPRVQTSAAVYLEGFLYKTGLVNKGWKRRWVVLHWDEEVPLCCMMYYRTRGANKPAGTLHLEGCSLSTPDSKEGTPQPQPHPPAPPRRAAPADFPAGPARGNARGPHPSHHPHPLPAHPTHPPTRRVAPSSLSCRRSGRRAFALVRHQRAGPRVHVRRRLGARAAALGGDPRQPRAQAASALARHYIARRDDGRRRRRRRSRWARRVPTKRKRGGRRRVLQRQTPRPSHIIRSLAPRGRGRGRGRGLGESRLE